METHNCLETKDLRHRYASGESVLQGVDLQVPQGSIYGFLGPNGAGKTTTLRLVLGLLKKQAGTITIFGQRFESNRLEILEKIGSLIESPSLYEHLTAHENLTVWQKIFRCEKARISEVLTLVGLSATGKKKAGEFSLGMKQRMALAVALLHRPPLLILDEPTNGLDPNGVIEIRQLLLRLNREEGVTVVISSHLLAEIEKLVTHLGVIHRGHLVFQGTLGELKQKNKEASVLCLATSDNEGGLKIIRDTVPTARVVNGKILLEIKSDEQIARLNRELVAHGIDVHEISPIGHDLESIFMDLIGERAT